MAARKPPPVKFVKQYTSVVSGNVFRMYRAPDGLIVDVRIRKGRKGRIEYTNAQAKDEASREVARLRRGGEALTMARVKCPSGHRNTAHLGRNAYGDDIYECYGCEKRLPKTESFQFVAPPRRRTARGMSWPRFVLCLVLIAVCLGVIHLDANPPSVIIAAFSVLLGVLWLAISLATSLQGDR
jgi:hypothetical protein